MRLAPTNIALIGEELAIAWNDGTEIYLFLATMRKHCPCAGCGGEPDVLGHVVKPNVTHTPASCRLRSYQIIGGYALQPVWEDGHTTGLYSFPYLKKLAELPPSPK